MTALTALLVIFTGALSVPAQAAENDSGRAQQQTFQRGQQRPAQRAQEQQRFNQQGTRQRNQQERERRDPPVQKAKATCRIAAPANPTSATGLATPYVLMNGSARCSMASADTAAFVEATIVSTDGTLTVYHPLVIDAGTTPAVPPVPPALRAGDTVGVWFGFQGDTLDVVGDGAAQCVDGLNGSLFGQFAYCGAAEFFAAARNVPVPPLGLAADGRPCPTVRDFSVVDQDQSDNVTTQYLLVGGRTAQDTAANRAALGIPAGPGPQVLLNASDNGLLNRKINPALGCDNFTVPSADNPGTMIASLATNELQAARQAEPVALIPVNNPMTKVGDAFSAEKTALYRVGVGQPVTASLQDPAGNARRYCNNLVRVGLPRLKADREFFIGVASPDADFPNLNAFMIDRFKASLVNLGC